MKKQIGINGFGRIGRLILRALSERKEENLRVVALNDLMPTQSLSSLYNYDSVHGPPAEKLCVSRNNLVLNAQEIHVFSEKYPEHIDWSAQDVQIVFECSGRFVSRDLAIQHVRGSVKKVLLSAPGKNVDHTVVFGVNHNTLSAEHQVVSNASCTTNCLAPLVYVLDQSIGVAHGHMTTIHGYTADQSLVDTAHKDLRRARAGALSVIPTSTGATQAVECVLPHLKGKLDGYALRVPVPNVSAVDFTFQSKNTTTIDEVNTYLTQASHTSLKNILAINEDPLVSIDFNHRPESSIVDVAQTRVLEGRCVHLLAWYDNEWGFANRMIDTAKAWLSI